MCRDVPLCRDEGRQEAVSGTERERLEEMREREREREEKEECGTSLLQFQEGNHQTLPWKCVCVVCVCVRLVVFCNAAIKLTLGFLSTAPLRQVSLRLCLCVCVCVCPPACLCCWC